MNDSLYTKEQALHELAEANGIILDYEKRLRRAIERCDSLAATVRMLNYELKQHEHRRHRSSV